MHCFAACATGQFECSEPGLVAVAVAATCTARCGAQLFSQQLPTAVVVIIVVLLVVFTIAARVAVALVVLPFTLVVIADSCLWLCRQLCVSTARAACGMWHAATAVVTTVCAGDSFHFLCSENE